MRFTKADVLDILNSGDGRRIDGLRGEARRIRESVYGNAVYVRGLIEFTNCCRNNCNYCGIRAANKNVRRYRLTKEEILGCCRRGSALGFKTFVLQGGEDPGFSDRELCEVVYAVKSEFPDCAVTLSVGEREESIYRDFFSAGADRYLLRHETANPEHYRLLHPPDMSLEHRKRCLWRLKDIGFQVGAGFMVGSPWQTRENLAEDIVFLEELEPHMVGIGPFIPHRDTEYRDMPGGDIELALNMLSITRLALPKALLPATTALGTISADGRERGIMCGANVVMPNLSPLRVRGDYSLYDNKICTGDEAAECIECLGRRMESIGCRLDFSRGDCVGFGD